jgi:hypothetical protein
MAKSVESIGEGSHPYAPGLTTRECGKQLATARGCPLGLVLGNAVGAADAAVPTTGPLRITTAGQLACFTIDGMIRANVRLHL